MRLLLFTLITLSSLFVFSQSEEDKIRALAKQFSADLMAQNLDAVVAAYTDDGKIFPAGSDILEGKDLKNYWNPEKPNDWKIVYHKITPKEIKVLGDEAYDYGYYEGKASNGTDTSEFKGKYVIIWRKEEGSWKMYLDIWNRL